MDSVSPERRSEIMGRVASKDTRPELVVRRLLHKLGYRFRLHRKSLPGKPDIVLPRWRALIFVHGCFWHRHDGCPSTRTPKSRVDFWTAKFDQNVKRDAATRAALAALGWRVLVVWECELRHPTTLTERLDGFIKGESCDQLNSSQEPEV